MAFWGEGDQRRVGTLVELITASLLVKLNPPARGDDVVSVTLGPEDLKAVYSHFYVETEYQNGEMTLFATPLP